MLDEYNIEAYRSQGLRELLENFDLLGFPPYMAIVANDKNLEVLKENIRASIIASGLSLSGIDYAKKQYAHVLKQDHQENHYLNAYRSSYAAIKNYLSKMLHKLIPDGERPSLGEFGAQIVLQRLSTSFFSAHLLYQMGQRYEGHAISRMILEQISWAYQAYPLINLNDIKKIQSTHIPPLKKIDKNVGELYGYLSAQTHISYKSHREFLLFNKDTAAISLTQQNFYEYGETLFHLADLFGIVWEISQYRHLKKIETITMKKTFLHLKARRPFLSKKKYYLEKLKKYTSKTSL